MLLLINITNEEKFQYHYTFLVHDMFKQTGALQGGGVVVSPFKFYKFGEIYIFGKKIESNFACQHSEIPTVAIVQLGHALFLRNAQLNAILCAV